MGGDIPGEIYLFVVRFRAPHPRGVTNPFHMLRARNGWALNSNKVKEERWLLKASCGTDGREPEEKGLRAQHWPLVIQKY
jgi:hypothetical protein